MWSRVWTRVVGKEVRETPEMELGQEEREDEMRGSLGYEKCHVSVLY